MDSGKSQPIQVLLEGINVKSFLDEKFIGLLEKSFPNVAFQHVCVFVHNDEDKERIYFGHHSPEHNEKNILMVDTDRPETLEKALQIIKSL